MKRLNSEDLIDRFAPTEGFINFYYGRIGDGKTYSATADIIDFLKQGHVVYANWKVDFAGFDERLSTKHLFWRTLLFWNTTFYNFPRDNFHFFDPDNIDVVMLARLANVDIFIDEGQWIFDSHTTLPSEHKKLILHTRHYNRSLNIISQRTSAIRVDARGNVNRFFKCEQRHFLGIFRFFQRTEYQDMTAGDVDDSENAVPISTKVYRPKNEIFMAYDTHAMRGANALEMKPHFEGYDVPLLQRARLLFSSRQKREALLTTLHYHPPLKPVPEPPRPQGASSRVEAQSREAPQNVAEETLLPHTPLYHVLPVRKRKLEFVRRTQALVSFFGTSAPSVAALRAVRGEG